MNASKKATETIKKKNPHRSNVINAGESLSW